ncbi:MAG: LPS-assembly protein LptD, partial [Betaproteobacteria bacterium]|nr:LPS-assembly protein LptD [Betaproteobacteria bacterium]
VQNWQTLQVDPLNPIASPYNRAQLNFRATKQNVAYTDFEFNGHFVNFGHPTLVNGRRTVAYPSMSLPLQASYGYLTPRIGLHLTRYDLDSTTTATANLNRAVPVVSAESGVVFERGTDFYGHSLLQTLEPKIHYVYIPTRTQNQLPNFDSAQQDINFATLYSENQFSGSDRINDANQITMGVTSRLLHQDTGVERLRVGVAQRYYFKSQEVTLPGVPARSSTSSDLLAALSGTIAPHWTADAGWQYNTDFSQTQKLSGGVRYQPAPGKVMNFSYRFTHDALRLLDVSSQWPLTGRLSGVARWNYSIQDSRLLEGLAGLEYNGGCWAFRIVGHHFATTAQNKISSVFLQLELNGVSRIGSNPLELLRRNIAGYRQQEMQTARPEDSYPGR